MLLPLLLYFSAQWQHTHAAWQYADPERYPRVPDYGPQPGPDYMVDNQNNYYGTAPDKGRHRGPVWRYSGSLDTYMRNLGNETVVRGGYDKSNSTRITRFTRPDVQLQADGYWLSSLGPLGSQPLAGDGYQFFRDVTDFGADNTGETDATEAINAAVSSWNVDGDDGERCGEECGNTFTMGAIIYFPAGTYKLCTPVIQLYYTQFIGDVNDPPTIKGCDDFQGIALFDTDPYIPGASGAQWYINQNQFFRQIRNFIFDLTDMPLSTEDDDQPLVPTGIHWQVAQATSLQNLVFNMPDSDGGAEEDATTAVGIFTENGSGGFVSDLTFNGGNIGWRVGSQQFTARNLKFNDCLTAVQMIWDWGFTWQRIEISGGAIAFNISGVGGDDGQGVGSISLIDSEISDVPVGILTHDERNSPNIVLDNTVFNNVARIVQVDGGETLLSENSDLWATGRRYNGSEGTARIGDVVGAPARAQSLLDSNGRLFVRSRPQQSDLGSDAFLVATEDGGCDNDGSGDQASCINTFLREAASDGKIAYFPTGIYTIGSTVFIPTGSRLQGSSWSQIQGSGYFFSDMHNPRVMIRVGNRGDIGTMEIVEMLFSVKGNTAGAVLMEWNVAPIRQGAAAMWDSHFRIGGGKGTDLDIETCPKFGYNENCIAAALMLHVTSQASGYFENVWAWLADHDNDASVSNQPDSSITQISIYGARGILIESPGPSWFYGGGSEHSVLYNYLISNAKAIYLGHIQTKTPYFQPTPGAPAPFGAVVGDFPNDPDFSACNVTAEVWDEQCRYAWGLRIIDSTDIVLHSAGLYSFFNEYFQDCIDTNNCQSRILEVKGSEGVVIYNLFTVATVNIALGIDDTRVLQRDNQRGFTTEVSVWLPLPGGDSVNIVYVGDEIFEDPVVSCDAPCVLVIPSTELDSPTTISPSDYITSLEYGTLTTSSVNGAPVTVFVTRTTEVVLTIPPFTLDGIPFSDVNVTSRGEQPITIYPRVPIDDITLQVPDGEGGSTRRVIELPPWPLINQGPSGTGTVTEPGAEPTTSGGDRSTTYWTGIRSTVSVTRATVLTVTFPSATAPTTISCPAVTEIAFRTPDITVRTVCTESELLTLSFVCPTTRVITLLGPTTAVANVDCSLVTSWSRGVETELTEPVPTFTTWPPYGTIEPIETRVSEPEPDEDGDGVNLPCDAWFFFICISYRDTEVGGWHIILPPGIYGPGPPPTQLIDWPPGFKLRGRLPSWPRIAIGNDGQITTEEEPECETRTASACSTTTHYFGTTSDGSTITTSESTSSHCETISGCSVSDSDESTTTEEIEGTQTVAPVGTWIDEAWPTEDLGDTASRSIFARFSAALAAEQASRGGTVISFTPGPTASPTCASGTGCGGQDPKDPSSGGHRAPTTTIGEPTTSSSSSSSSRPDPPQGTQAVLIGFESVIFFDGTGNSNSESSWLWYELNIGGSIDVCDDSPVFSLRDDDTPVRDPGYPPSMEADEDVWGRSGCRYIGNDDEPGDFQCDGVDRFRCERDSQFDETLSCSGVGYVSDYRPRVRCRLPASRSFQGQAPPAIQGDVIVNGTVENDEEYVWSRNGWPPHTIPAATAIPTL
ncbi:hypothetical protein S7711_10046 [Stachybotrys chartarum IBT 7711]|uniref:Rhamnogalacturonase A/B/Epimerase-like pectate lyase domain-containing protein n=1 Tax=Stachybotrys chartarum (strain CBS 109288 / IBT 7711) TaxID=1280523 RepID=A0A084AEY0_STACB|nr:hypothetical protein S7711_10046 [Stachybotrys chartarum IBT 7711]